MQRINKFTYPSLKNLSRALSLNFFFKTKLKYTPFPMEMIFKNIIYFQIFFLNSSIRLSKHKNLIRRNLRSTNYWNDNTNWPIKFRNSWTKKLWYNHQTNFEFNETGNSDWTWVPNELIFTKCCGENIRNSDKR